MALIRKTKREEPSKKDLMEETSTEAPTQTTQQEKQKTSNPARDNSSGNAQASRAVKRIKLKKRSNRQISSQAEEESQPSLMDSESFFPAKAAEQEQEQGSSPQRAAIDILAAAALEREVRNGLVRRQESYDKASSERNHENVKQESGDSRARLLINDLSKMGIKELRELGEKYGINHEELIALRKQELIFYTLKSHTEKGGIIYAYGSLEILPDGYGFLRSPQNSYLSGTDDIYISPSQIRLFNLKTGDTVYGQIRSP
ncbi:MAG: Rho termination factor N-terminal domain-containing protein, partial [Spirochaetia bacterium]|nr:Rho termination factor N-terminal domain-containing protein [Spirochaetia bacterium]